MFRKIPALAAVLVATATLGVAAGSADAARSMQYDAPDTTFSAEPDTMEAENVPQKYISGTDDDYCEGQAKAANSWIDAAVDAWYKDDAVAQELAQRNADAIAGEANKEGCTIYD